ncbi:hypothetical protein CCACVL1_15238, partial [Corchorus capsularis]
LADYFQLQTSKPLSPNLKYKIGIQFKGMLELSK